MAIGDVLTGGTILMDEKAATITDEREARILEAMREGARTEVEIAERAGVPVGSIHWVLLRMKERGAVRHRESRHFAWSVSEQ